MMDDAQPVRVLIICGAPGTGKTVVAWEVGHRLQRLGLPHAVLDTDELDRVWPKPESVDDLIAVTRENLRALWDTFSGLGTRHLVLCGVMADVPVNRSWIEAAVPGAALTFLRLTAQRSTRMQRLRWREVGTGFGRDMRASDKVAAFVEEHDPPGMPTIVTDGKSVVEVADQVLTRAGWLSTS
jgi:hypothetical protein